MLECAKTGFFGQAARAAVVAAAGIAVLAGAPREARAENHKNEKLGFSLTAPSKWKPLPISTDEQWLVASFQCPRQWEWSDAKTNSWTWHQPKLDVVIIPNSAAEQRGGEITQTDDKIIISRQAPWTDFKEYLDKTLQKDGAGGFFFSKEEETKVGGMKVMVYEVTMEKFTSTYNNAPRKYFGWAFYGEDAIYGIVGDALIRWEDKIRPDIEAAAKSFKIFPRTGVLPGAAITPGEDGDVIVKGDPKKQHVTDDELKKERVSVFNTRLGKIRDSLAAGWKIKESENFAAVTHCDDKFTKEVLDHAEALRGWLDQNLGFVGNGYAGKIIVRVCADDNERQAMYSSMKGDAFWCEVVTGADRDGWFQNRLSDLNGGIYRIWLRDRNRELSWSLPPWISMGMSSCIQSAVSKGKKITDFKATTWDNVALANLRRGDKLIQARSFFSMGWDSMFQDYENMRQAEYFVRYLLVGGAQRNGKFKNLLGDYIKNLAILVDESKDSQSGAGEKTKEPESEAEEAALQRAQAESWKSQEQEILKKLIEKTFQGWEEKDWAGFNASYWKELGV